jgi:DNA helicase-2/ATP-dependent DNA helicase PcrA
VDEIFDANNLDLAVVILAGDIGIPITLIGDPWQALYEFRGAKPELIPRLVETQGYATFPVSESFRFVTDEMRHLATDLPTGRPVALAKGTADEANVVLAAQWDTLWQADARILPLSFGKIDNQTDAALVILLDQVVKAHFNQGAVFATEAITLLGLDPDIVRADGPVALMPVLALLSLGTPSATAAAIDLLRKAMRQLGSRRQLRRLKAISEAAQLERLQALAQRMKQPTLVPGMTVHQAKGQEWPVVGVRLTPSQVERLSQGLSQDSAEDRLLYVAITRARSAVRLV